MNIIINDMIVKIGDNNIINKYNKNFEYLFVINYHKYIYTINTNDFTEFIMNCLEFPLIKPNKFEFEINIILLVTKYFNSNNVARNIITSMIGSMLIFNIKYKKYNYIKKLHNFIHCDNNIKYLIILANNMTEIKLDSIIQETNKHNENINMLDFIFDYYQD